MGPLVPVIMSNKLLTLYERYRPKVHSSGSIFLTHYSRLTLSFPLLFTLVLPLNNKEAIMQSHYYHQSISQHPTAQQTTQPSGSPVNDNLMINLRRQVEFYFSEANLYSDQFLLSILNSCLHPGLVPAATIASFPKVREMYASAMSGCHVPSAVAPPAHVGVVVRSLAGSSMVQVSPDGHWLSPIHWQGPSLQLDAIHGQSNSNGLREMGPDSMLPSKMTPETTPTVSPTSFDSNGSTREDMNPKDGFFTLAVHNIPPETSTEQLLEMFSAEGAEPRCARQDVDDTWWIEFSSHQDAMTALSAAQGKKINGAPILVQLEHQTGDQDFAPLPRHVYHPRIVSPGNSVPGLERGGASVVTPSPMTSTCQPVVAKHYHPQQSMRYYQFNSMSFLPEPMQFSADQVSPNATSGSGVIMQPWTSPNFFPQTQGYGTSGWAVVNGSNESNVNQHEASSGLNIPYFGMGGSTIPQPATLYYHQDKSRSPSRRCAPKNQQTHPANQDSATKTDDPSLGSGPNRSRVEPSSMAQVESLAPTAGCLSTSETIPTRANGSGLDSSSRGNQIKRYSRPNKKNKNKAKKFGAKAAPMASAAIGGSPSHNAVSLEGGVALEPKKNKMITKADHGGSNYPVRRPERLSTSASETKDEIEDKMKQLVV